MKPNSDSKIVSVPREASILGDDRYLIEMTERLQKLRSLMAEQDQKSSKKRRWLNKRMFSSTM